MFWMLVAVKKWLEEPVASKLILGNPQCTPKCETKAMGIQKNDKWKPRYPTICKGVHRKVIEIIGLAGILSTWLECHLVMKKVRLCGLSMDYPGNYPWFTKWLSMNNLSIIRGLSICCGWLIHGLPITTHPCPTRWIIENIMILVVLSRSGNCWFIQNTMISIFLLEVGNDGGSCPTFKVPAFQHSIFNNFKISTFQRHQSFEISKGERFNFRSFQILKAQSRTKFKTNQEVRDTYFPQNKNKSEMSQNNMFWKMWLDFSWVIVSVLLSPKINNIGFGAHGHVGASRNHENERFESSHISNSQPSKTPWPTLINNVNLHLIPNYA